MNIFFYISFYLRLAYETPISFYFFSFRNVHELYETKKQNKKKQGKKQNTKRKTNKITNISNQRTKKKPKKKTPHLRGLFQNSFDIPHNKIYSQQFPELKKPYFNIFICCVGTGYNFMCVNSLTIFFLSIFCIQN